MNIVKVKNLTSFITDDAEFYKIIRDNPWGFTLEVGKLQFVACPSPQFGESFRKYDWSFRLINT